MLLAVLLVAAGCTGADPDERPKLVFLGDPARDPDRLYLQGATLAVEQESRRSGERERLQIVLGGRPSGTGLASFTDDPAVVAVLTVGGSRAIREAAEAVEREALVIFELQDDLYTSGLLGTSVFQSSTPHFWQASRLARYFGPDDRRYKRVGLAREPGRQGSSAAAALSGALGGLGVQFADAEGTPERSLARLAKSKPSAVVIEGSPAYISSVVERLSLEERRYLGRDEITDGWRPQVAGFDSLVGLAVPPGSVAVSDYALPVGPANRIGEVRELVGAFEDRFGHMPRGPEWVGYETVMVIAHAAEQAESSDDQPLQAALENLDGVRFGHLPVSFGPDDHVLPDRDLLGLWVATSNGESSEGWTHLMRTFTSDLRLSNILKEDWKAFFPGTDPRGRAPPYERSEAGVTTGPEDDFH